MIKNKNFQETEGERTETPHSHLQMASLTWMGISVRVRTSLVAERSANRIRRAHIRILECRNRQVHIRNSNFSNIRWTPYHACISYVTQNLGDPHLLLLQSEFQRYNYPFVGICFALSPGINLIMIKSSVFERGWLRFLARESTPGGKHIYRTSGGLWHSTDGKQQNHGGFIMDLVEERGGR